MSCRETAAGSALTTIARVRSGLPDAQVLSAFHALRASAPEGNAAPGRTEWNEFIDTQQEHVGSNSDLSDARRRSLRARLERARSENVDGRTFYALRRIRHTARNQQANIERQFEEHANQLRTGPNDNEDYAAALRARYTELESEVDRSRNAPAPEGYTEEAVNDARRNGLPIDRASVTAMRRLHEEVQRSRADRVLNGPQRVERRSVESSTIATVGYDSDGGRLELTFTRPGTDAGESRVYAYRNVPQDVYDTMVSSNASAGQIYNTRIRNHSEYRYLTQTEADLDSAARQCADCGQFASSSHACPTRIAAEQAAQAAEQAAQQAATTISETPPRRTRTPRTPAAPVERPAPEPSQTFIRRRRTPVRGSLRWREDTISYPRNITELRAEAQNHPTTFRSTYSGSRRLFDVDVSEGVLPEGSFFTTTNVIYDRPRRGQHTIRFDDPRCDCEEYSRNRSCRHIRVQQDALRAAILPAGAQQPSEDEADQAFFSSLGSALETNPAGTDTVPAETIASDVVPNPNYHLQRFQVLFQEGFSPRSIEHVQTEAADRPVALASNYVGARRHDDTDATTGYFSTSTNAVYERRSDDEHVLTFSDARCNCDVYARNSMCSHLREHQIAVRAALLPPTETTTVEQVDADLAAQRTEAQQREARMAAARAALVEQQAQREAEQAARAAQEAAEEARRSDFMNDEELARDARSRWAQQQDEASNYSTNYAQFEEEYNAAKARKAAGEQAVPFMTENVTGGLCTRESGRAFGVELEFDFPDAVNQATALATIGRELHALGLTQSERQTGYHSAEYRGYTDNHQGGWSFERDSTVSGEIVSPIMYDEPETWENVAKVCEIVNRNGGIANVRTGSHVHVGIRNTSGETATELVRMTNQYEDVMFRVSQNPAASQHRPTRWCAPNGNMSPQGYASAQDASYSHSSHNYGLNLQSVTGRSSDHAEIRHWDGSLNPAVIQTQIKISAALIAAAERNGSATVGPVVREPMGAHHSRLQEVPETERAAGRENETASARSFADTLFTRPEDKAQFAALFAVTNWQPPIPPSRW